MEQQRRPQARQSEWLDRHDSHDDRRSALSAVNGHQNRAPRPEPYHSEALRRWQTDSEGSASDRQREAQLRQYRNDSEVSDDGHRRNMHLGYYQAPYHRQDPRRRYHRDYSDDEESDSEEEDRRRRARQRYHQDQRSRRSRSESDDDDSRRRGKSRQTGRGSNDKDIPGRPEEKYTLMKAAKSALAAGGAEYIRCRAEGGDFGAWNGQKGKRIAVAAVSGSAIGMMRNGRLQNSGKKPYAEAFMTSVYAVDFLKRVLRHTEFGLDAQKEKQEWAQQAQSSGSRHHSR